MDKDQGFTLVELLIGTAVSAIAMAGVVGTLYQVGTMRARGQTQSLIDQLYIEGMQRAGNRNNYLNDAVLNVGPALKRCLAGVGQNCTSLPGIPNSANAMQPLPASVDPNLNASFNIHGLVNAYERDALVSRTVNYYWDCRSPRSCSGLVIRVAAEQLPQSGNSGEVRLRPRIGKLFIPARDLVGRGQVDFACGGGAPITGVNYDTNSALCEGYAPSATCQMPMGSYDQSDSCRPNQTQTCGEGFSSGGLFAGQASCTAGP